MQKVLSLLALAGLCALPVQVNADVPTTWYPSKVATTSNITSATTTQVVAAVAGQSIYVYWAGFQSSGANTSITVNFEYSTVAACASSVTTILPQGISYGSPSSGGIGDFIGANNGTNGIGIIGGFPFVVPAGNYLCAVTTGTVSIYAIVIYSQH